MGLAHNKTVKHLHATITISPNKDFCRSRGVEANPVERKSNFLHVEVLLVGSEDHETVGLIVITPLHTGSARIFRLIHSHGSGFVPGVTEEDAQVTWIAAVFLVAAATTSWRRLGLNARARVQLGRRNPVGAFMKSFQQGRISFAKQLTMDSSAWRS